MLIPFLGIFVGMTLWSQWFPIPGFTTPEQSFVRRLAGSFQLTVESWAFCDLVDTAASQRGVFQGEHPVWESPSHVGHGYANSTGFVLVSTDFLVLSLETDLIIRPGLVDEMPSGFPTPFPVPISVLPRSCDGGVTSSAPQRFINPIVIRPKIEHLGFLTTLWFICVWCMVQIPWALIAYQRQSRSGLDTLIYWTLKFLEGQPQIARVQFVGEDDSSSFDEEMDRLIAGPKETDEDILSWVMAADSCPESVSHVSVLSRSGGIWVHRIFESLGDEQALVPVSACNTTDPVNTTDDARTDLVSRHPWNSSALYASDSEDPSAPAEGPISNGADDERPDSTPASSGRRNRPSQAKRRREAKRAAQQGKKELQHSSVLASYASSASASLAMSSSSTPLSALAPVFVPGRLAEQDDLQSGPPSSAPLFASAGIDPPADCGTTTPDENAPPQLHHRRRRRRQRRA
ncbi:hypothetical protein N7516_004577 [Penicillium verrucosum]|uniref:uncharacterized protein n=1 Tax=Penicillium verrucosum TaxID=60171 RepID=UPI002544E297|nr:uncharacterized protein N7516_004577 [Penicillium verrucosum]KAJ5944409.1 hypothetical protein N7516_004577 [Penicillium verrucosum]